MKKILLFASVIAAFTFTSCSDDDNGGGGPSEEEFVKARIGGVDYTFDVVDVTVIPEDGYNDLEIIATTEEDPLTFIKISVGEGDTGPDQIWGFIYYPDSMAFLKQDFTSNVTQNDDAFVKGTFSGTVEHWDPAIDQEISITNGEFSVKR